MDPHLLIIGHEKVVSVFGRWPSFHDGEVHRLVLDSTRRDAKGARYSSIELLLRGWNLTEQVSSDGFYKQDADSVVHFLFERVYDLALDGLNHQNVISELELSVAAVPDDSSTTCLVVELAHCYGLSGSFKAASGTVLSVSPYEATSAA